MRTVFKTLSIVFGLIWPTYVSADQDELVSDLLLSLREQTHVPAFSVAVVRNGAILNVTTVGEKDIKNHLPATNETSFRLASVSKVIGATMLAELMQKGRLGSNDQIGTYLPQLQQHFKSLTVKQLLAHTSGVPHYQVRDSAIALAHYETAIDALDGVGDRALLFAPGTDYEYSSHAYSILSALYEVIEGRPLLRSAPEFMERMTGLTTPQLEDVRTRNQSRSNAFELTADGPRTIKLRDQSFSPFGTGFIATSTDLALFGDAVLHGPTISDATREFLFEPVFLNDGRPTGNYLYQVAFGWRVGIDNKGRTVYHHAGITPGARSVLILYPEEGLSIAFLSNAMWTAQIERTGFAIADIFLSEQFAQGKSVSHSFDGRFNSSPISGEITCEPGLALCNFSDNDGALTKWLRRFNHTPSDRTNWPAILARSGSGDSIILVTSVGLIQLMQRETEQCSISCFGVEVGNGRLLEIRVKGVR